MSALEPRIEAVRQQFGLSQDDFWQIKQNKQWVCKHAALEIVAVKANVQWQPPVIIEQNAAGLITSMVVTGKMGERIEWATGETNPTNYSVTGKQPAYPWAMSEKRAKDRVVLKLVGIHGLVYSEDEMPSTSHDDIPSEPEAPKQPPPTMGTLPIDKLTGMKNTAQRQLWGRLQIANRGVKTLKEFGDLWEHEASRAAFDGFPKDWQELMNDEIRDKAAELNEKFGDGFAELPPETQRMVRLASTP